MHLLKLGTACGSVAREGPLIGESSDCKGGKGDSLHGGPSVTDQLGSVGDLLDG